MSQQSSLPNADNSPRRYNRRTFTAPKLLLVEGPDEYHFFRFLKRRKDVQIHVYEGKDQLRREIKTIKAIEGFDTVTHVSIIRDAESDPKGALQSVLTQWQLATGDPLPRVASDDWFVDSDGRHWTVWIMPAPDRTGDLEELLWQAVVADDHRDCIETLMMCLDKCNPVPFSTQSKARLYAWLATQKKPIKDLYNALKDEGSVFDRTHDVFSRFTRLLAQF